jgi:hypothetical protein
MTTREIAIRLAAVTLLLVAFGVGANFMATRGGLSLQPRHHVKLLPRQKHYSTIELLHLRWTDICIPHPSDICA